ncbi:MAG: 3-hydroxybutyryl-CoA dehydrogenase [Deltaproteobacteria bacterium]|nr:3-hydroxybutyryl-CoA dehydrogenase [Deltaproteobacteria bacterium]
MTIENITKIGVLGAGQMGGGIAHVAAVAGYEVLLADVSVERADAGKQAIGKRLARGVSKGRMTQEDADAALARITPCTSADFGAVDFAVEAATENVDLKLKLFKQLDEVVPAGAILATNTSSISITKIGAVTSRPTRVIGMHFMNPVPVMKLVEVIRSIETADSVVAQTVALAESMGKTCVEAKDQPGFAVNRILMPYINEAFQTLYEGIASAEGIDTSMKLGTNVPMGPLTLADFIGLDTCLAIMEVLHDGFGDSKYRPSPALRKYVEAGLLGRKTGRGVFDYRS